MLRFAALITVLNSILPLAASAQSLHDRIQQANGLLRSGDADKALDSYHEIQVDHPDSPILEYNVGCAEYEKGVKALQSQEKPKDDAAFARAMESFDRAMRSGDPSVRESASFNRANSLAQIAKNADGDSTQADRGKAFQEALRAYDDVLNADPGNEGAKQNIDHLRYMLKKAPPPPPPQEGSDDSKPQDDQSGSDQKPQPSDPSNKQDEQKPDDQPQQQDQEQQDDNQSSQPDKPNDQDQANSSQDQQPDNGKSEQEQDEKQEDAGPPPPDRQSVEALLQSLEDQDKEIQKDLRKGARTARVRTSGWW